jgi:hypothetical protein
MQDWSAYNSGFKRGVDIGILDREFDVRKLNPIDPIDRPKASTLYAQGLVDGYKLGIRQREFFRANERLQEMKKSREEKGQTKGFDIER